jgi:predicted SprT family Zn-dependent metalloprotease
MQTDLSRFDAIRNKTSEVLALATKLYGVDLKPVIQFNLRGRVAGWAKCKICAGQKTYTLRFNRELIQGKHFQDIRDETVAHEVAHLVCYARPELGRKHDMGWKRVCLALGGNGQTRHDYDVTPVGGGIVYVTDRGHEVVVSKIIHGKIQQGRSYRYRSGKGSINRSCTWYVQGQNPPAETNKPATEFPPVFSPQITFTPRVSSPAGGVSKAEMVRRYIAVAKRNGMTQENVVWTAQSELGMPKGQAIRYVTENWSRVAV